MAIEFHVRMARLATIVGAAVQDRLSRACFAALPGAYVDRADVVAGIDAQPAADGTVTLGLQADVFWLLGSDLLAAPNTTPPVRAGSPVRVTVRLQVAVTGAVISLTPEGVDADGLPPGAGDSLLPPLGDPITIDLTTTFTSLGLPVPVASRADVADGILAVRFDAAGAAAGHLFDGQDWGLFIDGAAIVTMITGRIPAGVQNAIPAPIVPRWQPQGDVPVVTIVVAGDVPGFPAAGNLDLDARLELVPGQTTASALRSTIGWSVHIVIGPGIGIIESVVEDYVAGKVQGALAGVAQNYPAGGPVRLNVGDHTFVIDGDLPPLTFAGAQLRYSAVRASPAGMTLGGAVITAAVYLPGPLQMDVGSLSEPVRIQLCSELAQVGSGAPSTTLTPAMVTSYGHLELTDPGRFCGVDVVSPGEWIRSYLRGPAAGRVAAAREQLEFYLELPGTVAGGLQEPVQLIVRTSRGVRYVDFGVAPQIQVDVNGQVINAHDIYIPNCTYVIPGDTDEEGINWEQVGINWGPGGELEYVPDGPPTDWGTTLHTGLGVDVKVLTVNGMNAGELLQVRSGTHAIDVTADGAGRALIPVVSVLQAQMQPAMLRRAGGGELDGHVRVDTATFHSRATLTAGDLNTIAVDRTGRVLLTRSLTTGREIHDLTSLEPGPIDGPADLPDPAEALRPELLAYGESLPGVAAVLAVPGFAAAGVAIAVLTSGEQLVLNHGRDGTRVAGTFRGPVGAVDVAVDRAVAQHADRLTVYAVSRPSRRPRNIQAT